MSDERKPLEQETQFLRNQLKESAAGEIVLKSIADKFRSSFRKTDTASRWGGEDFLILFPETDVEGSRTVFGKDQKLNSESFYSIT